MITAITKFFTDLIDVTFSKVSDNNQKPVVYDHASGEFGVGSDIVVSSVRPASDSTTALQFQNAAGDSNVLSLNTSSNSIGVNATPDSDKAMYLVSDGHRDLLVAEGTIGRYGISFAPTLEPDSATVQLVRMVPFVDMTPRAVTNLYTINARVIYTDGSNTTTNLNGVFFRAQSEAAHSGDITNLYAFRCQSSALNGSGSVGTYYSFLAEDESAGTNAFAFAGQYTAGSGKFNLYMSGDADNYLAGDTGIGTSDPDAKLHVDGSIIFENLPTSDPSVAGQLWNDSGTMKISAG